MIQHLDNDDTSTASTDTTMTYTGAAVACTYTVNYHKEPDSCWAYDEWDKLEQEDQKINQREQRKAANLRERTFRRRAIRKGRYYE